MMDADTALMDKHPDRLRRKAAVTACLLSVGIHMAILFFLSKIPFDVHMISAQLLPRREVKSMKLMDVQREPLRQEPDLLSSKKAPSLADPTREIDALSVPPDLSAIDPSPLAEYQPASEVKSLVESDTVPEREKWEPRQEILAIENQIALSELNTLERRHIPRIERVSKAADIVVAIDRNAMKRMAGQAGVPGALAEISRKAVGHARQHDLTLKVNEPGAREGSGLFVEEVSEITPFRPIENLLAVDVSTYTSFRDPQYGYFKIEVKRVGADMLPVISKDIILVQDCSASMTEQRLYFCRSGLLQCLEKIGPEDRFNIVRFRDRAQMCFTEWSKNSPEAINKARRFIQEMTSGGHTDLFSSIQELVRVKRVPGRPIIVLLITDGQPTTGLTRSTDIIGDFSKLNSGAISVFTMGTVQTANSYLLDLLSYCNKGDSLVVTKGRWDIPASIQGIMEQVSRPVLTDVGFHFADGRRIQVYPVLMSNLYLDRALVLYGRYPRDTEKIVFQAVGQAGDVKCDMMFDVNLDKGARLGNKSIRQNWAKQKIYHLIGEYARQPNALTLKEIKTTSKTYRIKIPYEGKF